MSGHTLLLVSVGAITAAPLVAGLTIGSGERRRAGVRRTLSTFEQAYRLVPDKVDGAPAAARTGLPLGRQMGVLGRALSPGGTVHRLQRWLDYAGNPGDWPVERVIAAKGLGLIAGAVAGLLLGAALGGTGKLLLALLAGALLGCFGPDLAIYNTGVKRQEEIRRSLPDVLDTLTICVEAGQGFDAALAQVSHHGKGPMVGECARVLAEMRIGKSRAEAMRAMAGRTTVPELRGFASAVIQASDLGVAVGQVLRQQAKEMRVRRRQRAEEVAQKVPIKILFPTLFCLFPALFVVILGPGVINIIATFAH